MTVAGLTAILALVVGGVAFLLIEQQSRNSEVDRALERLALVTDGVEATRETQRAAELAGEGRVSAAVDLAEEANADLASLREKAGSEEDAAVSDSVALAGKVSGQIEASTQALLAARKAAKGDEVSRLREVKKKLRQTSRQNRQLTRQLSRAKRQLARAVAALTADLERLGALDGTAKESAEAAASQIGQPTPPSLEAGIVKQSNAESALLAKRLAWIEPRPGPRTCGTTSGGSEVLVNQGKVSCRDAFFVVKNSRGPSGSIAPDGWDCSSFGADLSGRVIRGAFGYSCVRNDTARITVNKEGVVAGTQLSAFSSPTGNIRCLLSESEARCVPNEYTWGEDERPPGCKADLGAGVGLSGSGEVICGTNFAAGDPSLPEAQTIEYGDFAEFGPFVCKVEESGVTCQNRTTRRGFVVSRESVDLW